MLLLVDATSRKKWIYGLDNLRGTSIVSQLQQFFVDVGRAPRLIQTDFNQKKIGGAVANLCSHRGISLRAAPANQQSKNGLEEASWKQIVIAARALLLEANLPKRFWFWAAREAALRLDMQPVTVPAPAGAPGSVTKYVTSPFELFYGRKPDFRLLFKFGSVGYFTLTGTRADENFESQS